MNEYTPLQQGMPFAEQAHVNETHRSGQSYFPRAAAGLALTALLTGGYAAMPESAAASVVDNCRTEVLPPSGHGEPVEAISPGDVVIVAHGGSTGPVVINGRKLIADFNTNRSEVRAAKQGSDAVEIDETQTRTDESVQQHNPRLQMVIFGTGTNGYGVIRDMSVKQIQRYHVTPHGEHIPVVEQSVRAISDYPCESITLEQKGTPTEGAIIKQDEALKSHNDGRGAIFSSSEIKTLRLDKQVDPDVTRMFIQRGFGLPRWSLLRDHATLIDAVGVSYRKVTRAWVDRLHSIGIRVNVRGMVTTAQYRHMQNGARVDQEMVDNIGLARHLRWLWRQAH